MSDDTVIVGALNEDSGTTGVNGDPDDNSSLHSGASYVVLLEEPVCSLVLGGGRGPGPFSGAGHTWTTHLSGIKSSYAVLLDDIPSFQIPSSLTKVRTAAPLRIARFTAQVLMWNPAVFPGNPEQFTEELDVPVWSSGRVTTRRYGTKDGMDIGMEIYRGADGERYLRFPFSILGFP